MKPLMLSLALLMFPLVVFAQEPLPAALISAKTATVVNSGVDQDTYEAVVKEVRDLKRWTLVTAIAVPAATSLALTGRTADITITISGENRITANPITGWPMGWIALWLTFTQDETVLYRDQLNGSGRTTKAMTRTTLKKLAKRL